MGIIIISHYNRIPINQPGFNGNPEILFIWPTWTLDAHFDLWINGKMQDTLILVKFIASSNVAETTAAETAEPGQPIRERFQAALEEQHQHEEPFLEPALQRQLDARQAAGTCIRVFTDGSCQHPETPQCSFAAFAAVIDLFETDEMRMEVVAESRNTQRMPSNFVPLFLGRTPGEQRIYRSEILCTVKVCETLTCAEIFTDSQSALDVVTRCQLASRVEDLMHLEDYDMVERLWFALRNGNFHFFKIDAHQNPLETKPPRFFSMGFCC